MRKASCLQLHFYSLPLRSKLSKFVAITSSRARPTCTSPNASPMARLVSPAIWPYWRGTYRKAHGTASSSDGLTVAAAVRARATLGDPYGDPYPAQAVLMVDDAANPAQRQALIALAQHQGGTLLENVARVEYVPVILDVPDDPHNGHAVLRAGHLATIVTRPLNHHDHICGNESNYYPPLTKVDHATSAVALTDEFDGDGLGSRWSTHGRRSAYIGSFSEGGATAAAEEPAMHHGGE